MSPRKLLDQLEHVTSSFVREDERLLLRLQSEDPTLSPSKWLSAHSHHLESLLDEYGGVLLRGFKINSLTEFNRSLSHISDHLMEYMFRSTPRNTLGGRVYNASSYPLDRHIPLHNEFSYFHTWPSRITFHCCIEPSTGGETPVASSARIYDRLPKDLVEEFERKKVKYIRNYSEGLDLSWKEVFQTESQDEVESYCKLNKINYKWLDGGKKLRTEHVAQSSISHRNDKKLWFNQAHLFHVSSLDPQTRQVLESFVDTEDLPRNSSYADGTPIQDEYLTAIREAYNDESIKFPWQRGDIMILDNALMAHGRTPYTGDRKIAVGMG